MKILLVFGTRPEAIKLCPLVITLRKRKFADILVCVTGQHREMLDQVLDTFYVRADYDLSIMQANQDLFDISIRILQGIQGILKQERPDIVLVHGDTTTAFATALACFYLQIPVGHVEAGLRTYNMASPFPEEFNRRAITLVSRYHFAPTELAKANLLREGCDSSTVFVTGNTVIDALKMTVRKDYAHPLLEWAEGSKLILITCHRRENLGEPMRAIFRGIRRAVDEHSDVKVIFPVHPNPAVRQLAQELLGNHARIRLTEPLGVKEFHNILARCDGVLSDSGGVQEEAAALQKRMLLLRDTTERPEGVNLGLIERIGSDEHTVYRQFSHLLEMQAVSATRLDLSDLYGDGNACGRITDILSKRIS